MITILDGGMGQELIARTAAEPTPLWATQVLIDQPELCSGGGNGAKLSARTDLTPDAYAEFAEDWAKMGATLISGGCEVGPAHIAELMRRLC